MLKSKLQKKRNFTLIELLVVIAIIAILAALLLPALKMAKESTYQIECINLQKQSGTAIATYMNDYGAFIPFMMPEGDTNRPINWAAFITGIQTSSKYPLDSPAYVESPLQCRCPHQPPGKENMSPLYAFGVNYTLADWPGVGSLPATAIWQGVDFGPVIKPGSVKNPGDLPVLADTVWGPNGWNFNPEYQHKFWVGKVYNNSKHSVHLRHLGGSNFMFMDTHCELLVRGKLEEHDINVYQLKDHFLIQP